MNEKSSKKHKSNQPALAVKLRTSLILVSDKSGREKSEIGKWQSMHLRD
jgi:hypothetical protein